VRSNFTSARVLGASADDDTFIRTGNTSIGGGARLMTEDDIDDRYSEMAYNQQQRAVKTVLAAMRRNGNRGAPMTAGGSGSGGVGSARLMHNQPLRHAPSFNAPRPNPTNTTTTTTTTTTGAGAARAAPSTPPPSTPTTVTKDTPSMTSVTVNLPVAGAVAPTTDNASPNNITDTPSTISSVSVEPPLPANYVPPSIASSRPTSVNKALPLQLQRSRPQMVGRRNIIRTPRDQQVRFKFQV
jgi:hypothetical protein